MNEQLFQKVCAEVERRGGCVTPRAFARLVLGLYLKRLVKWDASLAQAVVGTVTMPGGAPQYPASDLDLANEMVTESGLTDAEKDAILKRATAETIDTLAYRGG